MKKTFNKIGQVLQLILAAPVKLPGKVGNVLKYMAIGLGILKTVLDDDKLPSDAGSDGRSDTNSSLNNAERSIDYENQ